MEPERWAILGFLLFLIAAVGVIVMILFGIRGIGASQGEHTGYITAIEHNSNLIWSADLVYFKTDTESTQEDIYCIKPELLEQAKEIQINRNITTIYFKNNFFMWAPQCNGGDSIIWKVSGI